MLHAKRDVHAAVCFPFSLSVQPPITVVHSPKVQDLVSGRILRISQESMQLCPYTHMCGLSASECMYLNVWSAPDVIHRACILCANGQTPNEAKANIQGANDIMPKVSHNFLPSSRACCWFILHYKRERRKGGKGQSRNREHGLILHALSIPLKHILYFGLTSPTP
ncbi:hypothetical protein H112_07718 [Trichophyton rubrum D6]|uniref:Uncharacterized protein n=3 Tax=Trichophyton TaxID=5550 RepID=A0A087PFL5_TRIRC|nr:uncharacterized protein TERG_11540 [Trichophyton rubrum CBS 118892]EZF11130.1 hypothetical protein H100_07742 [Trichophyton rubrum MR850]EZF37994.1 hypothetical protein H102_07707 [Trichophyton rubrum CBS 100081]EZF48629.1 hypothetical protein H103_07730 [Trichophyton rubrum CBS 288.86]EZF59315.1 hypothetical protein H104_07679 [Trichophyton rubrum CBS 289.86]EZF69883.1 hypothetical protein H105_07734 [Trichophyton soudanense CBS 452.61]EZF80506.1 hypothetical protein H110_07728 [Trichophy